MKKRYEDYSCEEIKAAMLDPIEENKLMNYLVKEILRTLEPSLHKKYKEQKMDLVSDAYIILAQNLKKGTFKCQGKTTPLQIFKAYWVETAKRLASNISRKKESKSISVELIPIDEYDSNEDILIQKKERDRCFYLAFEKLADKCKSIIDITSLIVDKKSFNDILKNEELMLLLERKTNGSLRELKVKCIDKLRTFLLEYFDEEGELR